MNKTIWLLSALISSGMFLFSCSSDSPNSPDCSCNKESSSSLTSSSSSVGASSSSTLSSSSVGTSSSSTLSSSSANYIDDQDLVKKNITLSSDNSYADIDADPPVAYTKDDAANNLNKIDLVAYCGNIVGWCEHNSIYNPWVINFFSYSVDNVYFFEIPDDKAEVFKTGNRLYDILPTYNDLVKAGALKGDGLDEIPIVAGKVFFVTTSEVNYRIIIIEQAATQSVSLKIIELPFP